MILRPAFFFSGGGSGLAAAPTIIDAINNSASWVSGSGDPRILSTSGLSWTTPERILSFMGLAGGVDVVSLAGTNDTAVELASVTANVASLYMHELTVVSGALDASVTYDLNASSRACAFLVTVSDDTDTVTTPAEQDGSGFTQPFSASFSVSGVKNRLLVAVVNVRGAHVTNPVTAPSGYTMLSVAPQISNTTNAPTSTVAMTTAIATKVATASSGTIAAATWGGLTDIGTQPWSSLHFALEPA